MGHGPTPGPQGVGHIGQVGVLIGLEEAGQALGRLIERGRALGRQAQHLAGAGRLGWGDRWGLLDDHVGVGTADTEGADAGPAGAIGRLPGLGLTGEHERGLLDLEQGIRAGVVGDGGQGLVAQGLDGLDQAGRAGRGVEVADVRLGRRQAAEPVLGRAGAEGLGQRRDLDRIAERGPGAVGLEQTDRPGVDAAEVEGVTDRIGMAVHAGSQVADLAVAVVVDGRGLDDGQDRIAIVEGIGQAAQGDDGDPAGQHGSPRVGVEGPAMAGRGQDLALPVLVAGAVGELDRGATGQGQVALVGQQALGRQVDGDQRGRAGGLDVDRRPGEAELVGHRRGQEVLVVAGVTEQEPAQLLEQLGVRDQIVDQVRVHARPTEDPDGAVEPLGDLGRRFEGLPGALHEVPVLGVHHRGVTAADPEEPGIEGFDVLDHPVPQDVVGGLAQLGVGSGIEGLEPGQVGEAVLAGLDPVPEGVDIPRSWEPAGHAHDRNIGFERFVVGHRVLLVHCDVSGG